MQRGSCPGLSCRREKIVCMGCCRVTLHMISMGVVSMACARDRNVIMAMCGRIPALVLSNAMGMPVLIRSWMMRVGRQGIMLMAMVARSRSTVTVTTAAAVVMAATTAAVVMAAAATAAVVVMVMPVAAAVAATRTGYPGIRDQGGETTVGGANPITDIFIEKLIGVVNDQWTVPRLESDDCLSAPDRPNLLPAGRRDF